MNRRQFVVGASSSMLSGVSLAAGPAINTGAFGPLGGGAQGGQAGGAAELPRPVVFLAEPVKGDAKTAFEFFGFGCIYCAQYNDQFTSWGKTLPVGIRFEKIPLLMNEENDLKLMTAFYAAKSVSPNRIEEWLRAIFKSGGSSEPTVILGACSESGIPQKQFIDALKAKDTAAQVKRAIQKTIQYNIQSTPTLAVDGRYVVSPEGVRGDYGLLFQVANGLVSAAYRGEVIQG